MKISNELNHSPWFKILVSMPLILLLYFLLCQYNYIGTLSVSLQEPYDLKIFIDDWIPFVYWFLAPYLLWMLFPIASLIFAIRKKITAIDMSAMYVSQIFLLLSCFVIYLIFPTSAESVMIDTSTFNFMHPGIKEWVQMLYAEGVPYNAFPSYHVAPMVFIFIFLFYRWRALFWVGLPIAIVISMATVFLKYHFFVDILGGIVMGVFAYYFLYEKVVLKNMVKKYEG